MIYRVKDLVIDMRAREWCMLPYPRHPKGCPNYGKRKSCPPQAPLITEWADLSKPMDFVVIEFNLARHIEKMRQKHPNWSEAQLRCCLYWQGKVNKLLKDTTKAYALFCGGKYTMCPEAMGVNVIESARRLGLPIEINPQKKIYKIALISP